MSATARETTTPLMQQYFRIKAEFPEALLLFQVGDFYELFFNDAIQAAKILNIVLTKRGMHQGEPIPLCGVPVHALDSYLAKLVHAGLPVAICDQLEPAQAGKVVERGVTRVLTPGTLTEANLLDDQTASYLLSFFPQADEWALLFGELLTAQLYATKITDNLLKSLESELGRWFPAEILVPNSPLGQKFNSYFKQLGYLTSPLDFPTTSDRNTNTTRTATTTTTINNSEFTSWLNQQFDQPTQNLIHQNQSLKLAVCNFYNYLAQRQKPALTQFKSLKFYTPEDFLILDAQTQRHLELFKNSHDQTRQHSLLAQLDQTVTPMGSRMVAKWLARPLVNLTQIQQRQWAVKSLLTQLSSLIKLRQKLAQLGDFERVVGRIALQRAGLIDYLQLLTGLQVLPEISNLLSELTKIKTSNHSADNHAPLSLLTYLQSNLGDFKNLTELLNNALNPDSQINWLIKTGFNAELDAKRALITQASQKILTLEQTEQARTGINSLKIRYNQIQGYYIELTKANLHLAPSEYVRLQTLVNCERFISPQLQQLQTELTLAQQAIGDLEQLIFGQIKLAVTAQLTKLRQTAQALANLDALASFAQVAHSYNYICPEFNNQRDIIIRGGRHAVIEQLTNQRFVPNDTNLTDQAALYIITGPNMGGKSTYLRQVALITIMAQCGSFVPASYANLALVDRIFTRIGAGDQLSQGKSTFLVEMEETALICQLATKNSLVILDEVGRGTSTFDGLALAQAIVEYLHQTIGARGLFATHYQELTKLHEIYPAIVNYQAKCQQTPQGLLFLHSIVPGVADSSFGVAVAQLAGLPAPVLQRAQALLASFLTQSQFGADNSINKGVLSTFTPAHLAPEHPVLTKLKTTILDDLTPRQALELLWQLRADLN